MITQKIKAILFDLDGTLIDSEHFYFSNWAPILEEEFGLHITFDDWIREFAGHTLVRNVDYLASQYNIHTTEEFMWKRTRENYAKADMRTINLMPYAKELLQDLSERGIRIGLVTSSYQTTVDAVLGNHSLLDYFEFFVTREDVNNPKPNGEPYELAVQKLAISKEHIIAVEDTITGFTAAQNANLNCFAVSKHQVERDKLVGKTDNVLYDLKELSTYIK